MRQTIPFAQELETLCFAYHIDHAALGPARLTDGPEFFRIIPEIIGATENVFASAAIAAPAGAVSLAAVKLAAEIIQRCAVLSPDGLGSLRFAALANVPARRAVLSGRLRARGAAGLCHRRGGRARWR